MGNSLADAILLIRKHLLSIGVITDIVEERVYGHHFYDFDNQTVEMPLIIIDYDGGTTNYGMAKQKIDLQVLCYSKHSSSQSLDIYEKVYQNLHASQLISNNISVKGYAYETTRPTSSYNPQARAWFTLGKFTINLAG